MSHDINDHGHPMHKGPHHDMFIHEHNRGGEQIAKHTTTMEKLKGKFMEKDVAGSNGNMSMGHKCK
jgi:hypothetical protein